MALISIKEYAERNGLRHDNVRHKCQRGTYKTAQKIGRDWLIDENEVDNDRRVKNGLYVGTRRKKQEEHLCQTKEI